MTSSAESKKEGAEKHEAEIQYDIRLAVSNNSEYTYTRGVVQVSIGHSENACLLDMNHLYYTA